MGRRRKRWQLGWELPSSAFSFCSLSPMCASDRSPSLLLLFLLWSILV